MGINATFCLQYNVIYTNDCLYNYIFTNDCLLKYLSTQMTVYTNDLLKMFLIPKILKTYINFFLYNILAAKIDITAPTGTSIPTELARDGTNKNRIIINVNGANDIFQFLLT